ncbi:MAG: metallophosphoesterase [Chloroflexi bacterium]|nr:metallophosphoesterase [Chloroflexota bacterium]
MDENDLLTLRDRIGDAHLGARLRAQVDRTLRLRGRGRGGLHFENLTFAMDSVGLILRLTGLYRLGQRNATALAVRQRSVAFPGLPPAFAGLRILHISDLHLDGYPGFGGRIAAALAGQRFDLAVLTGDFRFYDTGSYAQLGRELDALLSALACCFGVYGILGNHDFIEMAPLIEKAGVRLLLNEAAPLRVGDDTLWLVGLDDAHFYGLHDFEKALAGVPPGAPRILLVHSPEVIPEAAAHGFGLYLAGHTHGGQICLPGGFAPYVNVRCARSQMVGAWRHGQMEGYTSAGTGSSGVFARFFCPPEIVIHELQAAH